MVGLKGRASVTAIFGMQGPGGPVCWLFMDKDMDTRGSNGCAVEIVVAIELGPSRKLWIEAGTT